MANKIDDVINELQKTITYLDWRDETRVTMRIDQVQKILKRVLNLARGSQDEQKYDLLASGSHINFTFEVGSDQVYQGPNVLNFGDVLKITAEAETGWELASLLVNGSAFTSGNTITINDTTCPQGMVNVVATANSLGFDLSRTSVAHGTITVTDATTGDAITDGSMVLTAGQTINITFAGDNGYIIHEFLINGTDYATTPPQQTITVSNYVVEDDVVISGSLSVVRYNVSVVTEPNTSIDIYLNGTLKTGTIRAVYGDVLTFDVTPDDAVVTINGDTYNEGDQYTVTSSVVIEVAEPETPQTASLTFGYGNGVSTAEARTSQGGDSIDEGEDTLTIGENIDLEIGWENGYTLKKVVLYNGGNLTTTTYDDASGSLVLTNIEVLGDVEVGITVTDGNNDLVMRVNSEDMPVAQPNATFSFTQNNVALTPTFVNGTAGGALTYGDSLSLVVSPDTGYVIDNIQYSTDYVTWNNYTNGSTITVDGDVMFEVEITEE